MVMLLRAPRMASIIAGKISSPLWKACTRLPPMIAGPSRTDISRRNCGSATPWRCSTFFWIFFSGVAKFIARAAATRVARMVNAMVQLIDRLRVAGERIGHRRRRGRARPGAAGSVAGVERLLRRDAQAHVGGLVVAVDQACAVAMEQLQPARHRQ